MWVKKDIKKSFSFHSFEFCHFHGVLIDPLVQTLGTLKEQTLPFKCHNNISIDAGHLINRVMYQRKQQIKCNIT